MDLNEASFYLIEIRKDDQSAEQNWDGSHDGSFRLARQLWNKPSRCWVSKFLYAIFRVPYSWSWSNAVDWWMVVHLHHQMINHHPIRVHTTTAIEQLETTTAKYETHRCEPVCLKKKCNLSDATWLNAFLFGLVKIFLHILLAHVLARFSPHFRRRMTEVFKLFSFKFVFERLESRRHRLSQNECFWL